jgi:hypothetical protein
MMEQVSQQTHVQNNRAQVEMLPKTMDNIMS